MFGFALFMCSFDWYCRICKYFASQIPFSLHQLQILSLSIYRLTRTRTCCNKINGWSRTDFSLYVVFALRRAARGHWQDCWGPIVYTITHLLHGNINNEETRTCECPRKGRQHEQQYTRKNDRAINLINFVFLCKYHFPVFKWTEFLKG